MSKSLGGRSRYVIESLESRLLLSTINISVNGLYVNHNSVVGVDSVDSFDFTLTRNAKLTAKVTGHTRDVSLILAQRFIDSTPVLALSDVPGNGNEFVQRDVGPGNYRINVRLINPVTPLDIGTGYTLALTSDFAGATSATARDLGTLFKNVPAITDFIGNVDDPVDLYKFKITTPGLFNATINGFNNLTLIHDKNANGFFTSDELLGTSTTGSFGSSPLAVGTYYLKVNNAGTSQGNYNLNVSFAPTDSAGQTLFAARNIGELRGSESYSDFVGDVDTDDFYRFTLFADEGPWNFRAETLGVGGDVTLRLILDRNANNAIDAGETLVTAATAATVNEVINRQLTEVGTYFVQVTKNSGNIPYRLDLSASSADTVGNKPISAKALGTLNGKLTQSEHVGAFDANDFYKFNMAATGSLRALLSGSGDADLQLIRDTNNNNIIEIGETLAISSVRGTSAETILFTLGAGQYYARILRFSGESNYSLSLTPDYAGNTTGAARVVTNGTFLDHISSSDTDDYYRINLGFAIQHRIQATLAGLAADANLQLLNSVGQIVASSSVVGTGAENINSLVSAPGTYYLRVLRISGDTNYSLSFSALPIDNASTLR